MTAVANPIFDLFPEALEDNEIHQYEPLRIVTESGLDVSRNYNIDTYKIVSKDLNSYLLPQKGYLDMVFRITDAGDGVDTLPNNSTTLSNVLAFFDKIRYTMNDTDIQEVEKPSIVTEIRNLLDYSQDYLDKQGSAQWFYKSGDADGEFLVGDEATTRLSAGADAARVRVRVPLSRIFSFYEAYPAAIRGVEHRWEFDRQTDYRKIIFGNSVTAKQIKIEEMSIWIPKILPSPSAESRYLAQLSAGDSTSVVYDNWTGYLVSQPTGSTNLTWQITTKNNKPKYVFVMFQRQSRVESINGADTNPSAFDHFNIEEIELKVNSKRFPLEKYRLNFSDATAALAEQYARAYYDFLAIKEKNRELDNGSLVSYAEYKRKYPIFAFDVSRDKSIFENIQTNYIEVSARSINDNPPVLGFAAAPYYAAAVICWESELEFNSSNNKLVIVKK